MAGERTPLFTTNGDASRSNKRRFYAKIAAAAALVVATTVVIYAATRSDDAKASSKPAAVSSITDDNWFCGETKFEADYIKLSNKKGDDEYFYWFVPSRSADPSKDPLVLWLTGGPGSSSMLAMFTENGPCMVTSDAITEVKTTWNRYSWTNNANVIWLDQPSGVGFSSYDNREDDDFTEADVGANMYAFLNGFLDKHPEFVGRDFYITGESYGGHYVPGSSHYIWQQNKKLPQGEAKRINLKGIAIGNGLTNPNIQYKYNQDMVNNQYNITLLTDAQVAKMKEDSVECIALTERCQSSPKNGSICVDAQGCWQEKLIAPFMDVHRNLYDFREQCSPDHLEECGSSYAFLVDYFGLDVVKRHVPVLKHAWHESDADVYANYVSSGDWSFAYHTYVADLLNDGLRVLIYAGDADLMCNWIGNRAWTLDLDWNGKDGYNAAHEYALKTQDPFVENAPVVVAGVARQFENFAFVRVYNAGHMVPTNQPAVSWVLIDKFFKGEQY